MPCETCRVEFTVFRRKRSCFDCRRYYCNSCLTVTKRCQRCAIFAKRPLLRSDLIKLKSKDLVFYLQSKHISTEGCLEKDELIGLVLSHVAQVDKDGGSYRTSNASESPGRGQAHPIDSLKQTCQNFFINLSDNISDSFSSFETKPTPKPSGDNNPSRCASRESDPTHIFEQPRVSTREIPTYASALNGRMQTSNSTDSAHVNIRDDNHSSSNSLSLSSPEVSPNTPISPPASSQAKPEMPTTPNTESNKNIASTRHLQETANENCAHAKEFEFDKSDCECSDDEIISTFTNRLAITIDNECVNSHVMDPISAGLGPSLMTNMSQENSKHGSPTSKAEDVCAIDISSQSSFEELGAIGGVSDESKATTDTNSSNLDQWQFLEACKSEQVVSGKLHTGISPIIKNVDEHILEGYDTVNSADHHSFTPFPQRTKKVARRRSDGYISKHSKHNSSDEDSAGASTGIGLSTLREHPETTTQLDQNLKSNCRRCGKNKLNIRHHVEKMRRHLESSQMKEEDIKRELQDFLSYLELRTKSVDCSETESHVVSPLSGDAVIAVPNTTIEFSPTRDNAQWDDDEGIHVYAAPSEFEPACIDSRFINLEDFEDLKDLENLTVKQLKEVLMLHRVDYKGCCEKKELLDRVKRLWKNMRSSPAVEKLATDELCKICMDAPIECVFLECGHMATCTNCGKVLNECPICRQYIVRVVRFFKA